MTQETWSKVQSAYPNVLVNFTNRDTGSPEWVRVDKIARISECQYPDHKGYAILSIEIGLEVVLIEADNTVEEFIEKLRQVFDG